MLGQYTVNKITEKLNSIGINFQIDEKVTVPVIPYTDQYSEIFLNENFLQKAGIKLDIWHPSNSELLASEVVMIMFGDREISNDIAQSIRSIKQKVLFLIPIIIFSKEYFDIPDDEVFGYEKQFKNIDSVCGDKNRVPLTAFCVEDVMHLSENVVRYFKNVEEIVVLLNMKKKLKQISSGLKIALKHLYEMGRKEENYFEICLISSLVEELNILIKEIQTLLDKEANSIRDNIFASINKIQRENYVNDIKRVKRYRNNARLWMASGFGSEYLDLSFIIKQFLDNVIKKSCFKELENKIKETESLLDFATSISILGTFSSGKTTFVNSLLGTRLRTTSTHNTAILTEIKYHSHPTPKVVFDYKQSVNIKLFKPDKDSEVAEKSPIKGKIIDIIVGDNFKTLIIENDQGEAIPLHIGNKEIHRKIKIGTEVKKDDRVTEGLSYKNYSWFTCYGKNDIQAILKMIANNSFNHCYLSLFDKSYTRPRRYENKKEITRILEEILNIAPEKYGSIAIRDNIEFLNSGLKDSIEINFYGELAENNFLKKEIILDETGWIEFQGDNNTIGYAEQPECYLFVERATLFINNDFLKLAKIIDTPGLGSITDIHDEISETYLRKSRGVVLIMIAMDMHIERETFWKLMSLLSCVYNKRYGKKRLEEVYFFCNWFKNIYPSFERIATKVEQVKKYLNLFRLNTENIYLCDLKSFLIDGREVDKEGEYNSYKRFKEDLRNKISELGPRKNLQIIKDMWDNVIRNLYSNEKINLFNLQKDKKDRKKRLMGLYELKKTVESVNVSKEMSKKLEEIEREAQSYVDVVNKNYLWSKTMWEEHKEQVLSKAESINSYICDEGAFSFIYEAARGIKNKMGRYDLKISLSNYPTPTYSELPTKSLENLIDRIIDNWPWITFPWGWYRPQRLQEVEAWFAEHSRKLLASVKEYSLRCVKWFNSFKNNCLIIINTEISSLENWSEAELEKCRKRIEDIENNIKPEWEKVSKKINEVLL